MPAPSGLGWGEDDALNALGREDVEVGLLLLRRLVGVAEQDAVAAVVGRLLDDADHPREVRVLDVRNDDAELLRPAATEAAGEVVRPVAEVRGGLEHPLAVRRCDLAGAGQDAGHRRGRHASSRGDLLERHHAAVTVAISSGMDTVGLGDPRSGGGLHRPRGVEACVRRRPDAPPHLRRASGAAGPVRAAPRG
jgi:hypothetical protein